MPYYMGVDIGTTSAKAVAFSEKGEVLASWSSGYKMQHPLPGFSEQDPDEICAAVFESIQKVLSLAAGPPLFVSFSAAMHALIVVNEEGKPITPCIIWADNRAADIALQLRNSERGDAVYHLTGVPLHAMSPLCKILWLRENDPKRFEKAHKFLGVKDYVFFRLFGEYVTDTSVASATGLLNIETLSWESSILSFAGICANQLPGIKDVRTIFQLPQQAATELGLPTGLPFVIGGSDGAMANLGTGATASGSMTVSIGTSSAARTTVRKPETDEKMRTFCYHVKDDAYIIGGPSNNGAVVLDWMKKKILESTETLSDLFAKAEMVPPGSDGLVFVPYILGERAPVWDSHAKGIFSGFSINHTQAHLIRATMEGVVFSAYCIVRILLEKKAITEIHATGGFAHSDSWVQMLADVCNRNISVSAAVESSALGAVLLGIEALQLQPFARKEVHRIFYPKKENHTAYQRAFETFEHFSKIATERSEYKAPLTEKMGANLTTY